MTAGFRNFRIKLTFVFFVLSGILCVPASAQMRRAEKIYRNVNDAVIRIYAYGADHQICSQGSGVILKDRGWVVTNCHVAHCAQTILGVHEGIYYPLDSIIAVDSEQDILVFYLSDPAGSTTLRDVPKISIADSDKLRIGQRIYAVGSPYGFENTITEGLVSGIRKSEDEQSFIQLSSPISKGSSGGAVVDAKARLIGISTLIFEGEAAQNLNFAIPINDVIIAADITKSNVPVEQPRDADFYYKTGYRHYLAKNYMLSVDYFEKAIRIAPQGERAVLYYHLGLVWQHLEQFDSAIVFYNRALSITEFADCYVGLGSVYYRREQYDKSIGNYELALNLVKDYPDALLGLGLAYYSNGELINSTGCLKKLIQLGVRYPQIFLLLGHISYTAKAFLLAEYYYSEALLLDPQYADAYLGLSKTYLKTGETGKAAEAQQNAFRLNPELRKVKIEP